MENTDVFSAIFRKMLKGHPLEKKAFIMRGEILQAEAFKPGQKSQLALQLEDDYTDKIIVHQKYMKKVIIVLAQYLFPPDAL